MEIKLKATDILFDNYVNIVIMKQILLLIFSIIGSAICAGNIDFEAYCKLTCPPNTEHTICKYKCEISSDCKEYVLHELTDEERVYVRDAHNIYRERVASGNDTRGENDAAQDMLVLNYHREIEAATLCLSRRCVFAHDQCRHTLSFDSAGQNLMLGTTANPTGVKIKREYNRAIDAWFNEIGETSKSVIDKFPDDMKEVAKFGHYTQMVWSTSKYLGCSMATWRDSGGAKVYIACHYSPAGNTLELPVYKFGSGCTGDLKPNDRFPALCGTLDSELVGVAPVLDESSGAPGGPGGSPGEPGASRSIIITPTTIIASIVSILPPVWFM